MTLCDLGATLIQEIYKVATFTSFASALRYGRDIFRTGDTQTECSMPYTNTTIACWDDTDCSDLF